MTDGAAPTARILSIGTEILFGETVDTNAAHLAGELARLGLELRDVRQLPDDRARIAEAFRDALAAVEVVIATGGLGPTHDDVTREGLADALGEELTPDAALVERQLQRFGGRDRMPESNLRQALLIPSAEPLENPIGSAPGWWAERGGGIAVLMPGVPSEMRRMWAEQVVPQAGGALRAGPGAHPDGEDLRHRRVFGRGPRWRPSRRTRSAGGGGHLRARRRGPPALQHSRRPGSPPGARSARPARCWASNVYGTDADTLSAVALRALATASCATLASVESGTDGALLAILSGHAPVAGEARFIGGLLVMDGGPQQGPPAADAILRVRLSSPGSLGRSRVGVTLEAASHGFAEREVRIHGSGPQRLRRAAFAALDAVRRGLSVPGSG